MAYGLTRFNPFKDLARLDPFRGLDEVFNESLMGPRQHLSDMAPRMDVSETDQGYLVKADIPGVKKEDIKVNIEGNHVSISAETQRESEQKSENMLCTERSWGQYYRSFSLPQPVDDTMANAEYRDGVLELTLPKKAGGASRKLDIH
jgi:HSP20 family protein